MERKVRLSPMEVVEFQAKLRRRIRPEWEHF